MALNQLFNVAVAEQLSAQANRLQELMGFFRIDGDDGAAGPGAAASKRAAPSAPAATALRFGQSPRQSGPSLAGAGQPGFGNF